ncbi:hypothetical protein BV210_04850 [Halorientalis sp. IM1011]|nr:hypothetical protein BV210_04850 [Halorientalis sp. IM1011]
MPVPASTGRPYLRIQPSTDPLTARTVTSTLRQLHGLDLQTDDGWLDIFRPSPRPTIEWLLVSDGQTAAIDYYLGIDPAEALDQVTPLCRGLVPNSYEFKRVEWHPDHLQTEDRSMAAVDFQADLDRKRDWLTRLTPFGDFKDADDAHVPLATIAELMANSSVPMVYQALVQPLPDKTGEAEVRQREIETGEDTLSGTLINALVGQPDEDDIKLTVADEQRIDELAEKDLRHPFVVNARAVAFADQETTAARTIERLSSALGDVSYTSADITGRVHTGSDAQDCFDALAERTVVPVNDRSLRSYLPGTRTTSRGIVADPTEVGNFCLLDGSALPTGAQRALETVPKSQTSIPLPPESVLDTYRTDGLVLGRPVTSDGTTTEPIALPPEMQTRNVGWIGQTGTGKSTSLITAALENHQATDGPEIIFDPKGGRMTQEYLRCHYARFGDLDDVIYFDCAEWLPAISFFDIQPDLEAGVPRSVAVLDRIGHYQEILRQLMGAEQYDRAIGSTDMIRDMLRALYDPIHGRDVVTNRGIRQALERFRSRKSPPAVSNPDLRDRLRGAVENDDPEIFRKVMNGAVNRVDKVSSSPHLNRVFNHRPTGIEADQPAFDFADWLDDDVVILFDTGRLQSEAKRGLTLVLLSNLWSALRRRRRRNVNVDLPLVTVYLEEAADVANGDLLAELLAQSRSFGCALVLAMQFPGQLEATDSDLYQELLNNVGTYVTGTVGVDHDLAHRFATDAMGRESTANRLRGLSAGQWFVDLLGEFQGRNPRPFIAESLPRPEGHPDRTDSGPGAGFTTAHDGLLDRTKQDYGLPIDDPDSSPAEGATTDDDPWQPADGPVTAGADSERAGGIDGESSPVEDGEVPPILSSTSRMPSFVRYDEDSDALVCTTCDSRFDSTADGMRTAIQCCHDLASVDLDDVPITSCNVTLSPDEIRASKWSPRQLTFLQAVHNAQQRRYDPIEYDIVHDSMIRLKEDVGIDQDEIDDLLDAGLLRHDGDHPQRYYSVTAAGRDAIDEEFQAGVDFGHGKGDLDESSQHVAMIEASARWLQQERVDDPEYPDAEVVTYYEVREGSADAAAFMGSDADSTVENLEQRRLDCVTLDENGDVVVAVEAERINHDVTRAVPEDYDKMAACEPDDAIWVVLSQSAGHDVLAALNEPADGDARVEKTYSSTTPPQQFRIDQPGLTAIYPMTWLQRQVQTDSG